MSVYEIIKNIHVLTAIMSISGFILRGIWMMKSSVYLQNRWVKVVPHVNDTILLVSAIFLVVLSAQYPGPIAWLNAKIVALLVYIILGTVALKRGSTKTVRIITWCLAILVFIYIFVVANVKTALIVSV